MSTKADLNASVPWTGIIAYLDTDTSDGRRIVAPANRAPRTAELPLILHYQPVLDVGHSGAHWAGLIYRVWAVGKELHADGATWDPDLSARLLAGEAVACGVDLDQVAMSFSGEDDDPNQVKVATDWRLLGMCAYGPGGQGSFPDAKIAKRFDRCPDCRVQPGSPHLDIGCDVEHCATTGEQRISCRCNNDQPTIWSGEHPAAAAARRYGFYLPDDGSGLPPELDLNRVFRELRWDATADAFLPEENPGTQDLRIQDAGVR